MFDLFLLFVSAGGELSAPIEECSKSLVGAGSPVLFCTQDTQVLGPDFPFGPLLTRRSL